MRVKPLANGGGSGRGSRAWRVGLGLLIGMATSGCEMPKVSPEHGLPPLVVISGKAEIPDNYLVQSGSIPAPWGFRISLARLEGPMLASGTIVSSSGEFSVSVPQSLLADGAALYEITLRNGLGAPVYSAAAPARARTGFPRVQISAASTAVLLGAKASLQGGRSLASWDFEGLAKDPQVLSFAQRIAKDAAERSNSQPGQTLLSSVPLPAEFQSGANLVIAVAEGRKTGRAAGLVESPSEGQVHGRVESR